MTSTYNRLMKNPSFREEFDKQYSELVTTDDLPNDPHSVPISDEEKRKIKNDPLYRQRLKKNPKLKNQIKKLGENQMIKVTFTSNNTSAISRQWHMLNDFNADSYNSWEISNPKTNGNTITVELVSNQDDNRLTDQWLSS